MPGPQDISADLATLSVSGWRGMFRKSLSAGILVVVAGLACLGIWFGSRLHHTLETEVGQRAGTLLETSLTRYAADFAGESLPPGVRERLDDHFREVSATIGVFDMMIWDPQGRVIYAARPELTGQSLPMGAHLREALTGTISVGIEDEFHADASSPTFVSRGKFFEIYVPIRLAPGNRIVAVGEYYQDAATAARVLLNINWQIWGAISGVGIFFIAILYLMLRKGDGEMVRQHMEFRSQLTGLTEQMAEDQKMSVKTQQHARYLQEQQENRLRQINADIHDGIGQLLTVALLRIKPSRNCDASGDAQAVQTILEEAMTEVQALLTGTSQAQPHDLPLVQAVRAVVDDHVRRTGTGVDLCLDATLPEPPLPIRIALCRFLREGLHNAFKHAGGMDQRVALRVADDRLEVSVSDGGGRLVAVAVPDLRQPMGLDNLRRRIERLGGTLILVRHDTQGMRLHASFPLDLAEDAPDARHHGSDRR